MTVRTNYEHLVRFIGDSTSMVRASDKSAKALSRIDENSRKAQAGLDRYNSAIQTSNRATSNFASVFGGVSLALLAREVVQAADSMTLLQGRLKLVTDGTADLVAKQEDLFDVAQDSRASLEATTSFYVRLAQRLGDTADGTLRLTEVTELVAKSLKLGGATAKETTSSLLQLSQALSSGLLRGDEFRSLSENAVGLMQAIADGAGVTQAKLRELSIAGKLTTEFILDALEKSAPQIREQFDQLPITFGDAVQRMQNVALEGINDLNNELGATEKLVGFVDLLAENLDNLVAVGAGLVALKISRSIGQTTAAMAEQRREVIRLGAEERKRINAKIVQERATASAILTTREAARDAAAAEVNRLRTNQAAIAEDIRKEKQLIKTNNATFGLNRSTDRLNKLQAKGVQVGKTLRVAQNQLAVSTDAVAAAQKRLGTQLEFVGRGKMVAARGARALLAALGGWAGIAAAAITFGALHLATRDWGNELKLTAESVDLLSERTSQLTGLGYEELVLQKKKVEEEIRWRSGLEFTNDALDQQLEVAKKLNEAIQNRINLTHEGQIQLRTELELTKRANDERIRLLRIQAEDPNLDSGGRAAVRDAISAAIIKQTELQATLNAMIKEEGNAYLEAVLKGNTAFSSRAKAVSKTLDSFNDQIDKIKDLEDELQGLLNAQEDVAALNERDANVRILLAQRIDTVRKELSRLKGEQTSQKSIVEKLIEKENRLKEEILQLGIAHKKTGKEVSIFSVEIKKKQEELRKSQGLLTEQEQKIENLKTAYRENKISVVELTNGLIALGIEKRKVNTITNELLGTVGLATERIKGENQALRDQIEIAKTRLTQGPKEAQLQERLIKLARELGVSVEDLTEDNKKLIVEQQRLSEQKDGIEALNAEFQSFSDSLAQAIVNGEDLGEFFKNLWKKMVKDFLASGITKLISSLFSEQATDGGSSNPLGTILNSVLGGGGSGSGTIVGNTLNSVFGGTAGSTIVGNAVNSIGAALGIGGTSTVAAGANFGQIATGLNTLFPAAGAGAGTGVAAGAAPVSGSLGAGATPATNSLFQNLPSIQQIGQVAGVALGAYNVVKGLEQGGSAGIGRAVGGGASLLAGLGVVNPVIGVLGAVMSTLLAGRGARDIDQIIQEDYLPALFGINPGSAVGAGGGLGFAGGGNTGIFGSNFGILGTGVTAQLLADGGENGNGGFFTGAQVSLDALEQLFKAAGFSTVDNVDGVLRVLDKDKNVQAILDIWQSYGDSLDEAIDHSQVFETAVRNNLLGMDSHAKLFFENFSVGFGESAFEARESLLAIDKRFDELRENGTTSVDALFQAISERYGIGIEDAKFFVDQTKVSIDRWVDNFENASGDMLATLLEFNEDGVTQFESLENIAVNSASNIQTAFVDGLTGVLSGIDLGVPTIPNIVIPAPTTGAGGGGGSAEPVQIQSTSQNSGESDIAALTREFRQTNKFLGDIVRGS